MTRKNFIIVLGLILFLSPTPVLAERYLTIPMFNYDLTSFFDHDIPDANPVGNQNFIRYDGQQWTDGSATLNYPCTDGVNCYDGHNGVDLSAPVGADVIASAPGTITTYIDDCGGKTSRVYHPEEGYSTLYAHLDSFIITSGSVDRFEHIAESGNSGNCTTGPHLHFGVREGQTGGRRADPYGWNPEPDSPVQNDPCEGYSSDLCVDLGYLWTTDPPSLEPPGGDDPLPVINVSGTISEDTTWEAGYVYLIQGSVTVVENVTLTLEPGVIVKFQNTSSRFNIYGNLYAQGTQQNKIHFTSYKDDTVGGDSNGDGNNSSPAPSNWRQITVFENGSADLSHAVLRYGGYTCAYCGINPGGLLVDGGQLTLADTLIEKNNYGIYFKNITGTTSISNSTISDNTSYGIFSTGGNHDIYLSNSTISNHSNTGIYASASATTTVSLLNNTFQNNQTRDGYFSISNINFINQGNTTSGTGGNGFHISGTLLGNQIWNPGVPYIISTVTLPADTTLTINPNTIVKFQNTSSRFNIYGNLYAQGTQQNKIYFTSYKDDTVGGDSNGDGNNSSPAPSNWRQITVFENGSADLSHAVLRYGGYTCAYCGINPGGLLVDGGQLTLADTLIEKNNYGIYRRTSGNVSVTQSSIKENTSYGIYHTGTGTTTATSNWWGDASGPYHPQNNPNGQGDRVSNNVEFSSWLIEDPFWKQFIFPKK